MRKQNADHNNLLNQVVSDWRHHNEVHEAHGTSHEREHKQTQDAIDKAEKTAHDQGLVLASDVQRLIASQGSLVTKDQLSTEFKAMDGRITLLERGASTIGGRDLGVERAEARDRASANTTAYVLFGAAGLCIGLAGVVLAIVK